MHAFETMNLLRGGMVGVEMLFARKLRSWKYISHRAVAHEWKVLFYKLVELSFASIPFLY